MLVLLYIFWSFSLWERAVHKCFQSRNMLISLYAYCILGESIIWFLVQFSDGFCDLCEVLPGTCFYLKWEWMFNEEWLYQLHINCLLKNECPSNHFFFFKARRLNRRLHIYTWNLLKTVVFEGSWLWLREEFAHTA